MADYLGVNATKAATPTSANITDGGLLGGRVRVMVDTYEAAGEAAGKTIAMGKALPAGAYILGVTLAFDDLSGAGATISVGDEGSATRYMSGIDVATAASVSSAILVDGLGYKIGTDTTNDDTQILLTIGVAAITGTVKLVVLYATD